MDAPFHRWQVYHKMTQFFLENLSPWVPQLREVTPNHPKFKSAYLSRKSQFDFRDLGIPKSIQMETTKPQHSTGPACCCYSPSRLLGPVASGQPPHDRGELPDAGARCRPGALHNSQAIDRNGFTASKTHWA